MLRPHQATPVRHNVHRLKAQHRSAVSGGYLSGGLWMLVRESWELRQIRDYRIQPVVLLDTRKMRSTRMRNDCSLTKLSFVADCVCLCTCMCVRVCVLCMCVCVLCTSVTQ